FTGAAVHPELWHDAETKGAVQYVQSGKVWIVGGEPLADDHDLPGVTTRFINEARRKRKIVAFLPTTERFARVASDLSNLRVAKVGAAPYFDLTKWKPRGNSAKKLRLGCNRAHRAGVEISEVAEVTESFRAEVAEWSRRW